MELHVCNKCGKRKPVDAYYVVRNHPNSPLRRRLTCKACIKLYHAQYKKIGRTKGKAVIPQRLASIDCLYKCPICLMAYPQNSNKPFASQAEADRCCRILAKEA